MFHSKEKELGHCMPDKLRARADKGRDVKYNHMVHGGRGQR